MVDNITADATPPLTAHPFFKPALGVILLVLIVGVFAFAHRGSTANDTGGGGPSEAEAKASALIAQAGGPAAQSAAYDGAATDKTLMRVQPNLSNRYGQAPEGFIWLMDGRLQSLGDKSLDAQQAAYAYLQGATKLDMANVARFSRDSAVYAAVEESTKNVNANSASYEDQFLANMYRTTLTSVQILGIANTTTFADDKVSYTVKLRVLDLTNKDFWREDRDELFRTLYTYDDTEADTTKAEQYLYEYVLKHYKADSAPMREVEINITVQKYPDLDSGWLVSVDKELDALCRYQDGKLAVNYIRNEFRDYRQQTNINNKTTN